MRSLRVNDALLQRTMFVCSATAVSQFPPPSFVAGGDRCPQRPVAVAEDMASASGQFRLPHRETVGGVWPLIPFAH